MDGTNKGKLLSGYRLKPIHKIIENGDIVDARFIVDGKDIISENLHIRKFHELVVQSDVLWTNEEQRGGVVEEEVGVVRAEEGEGNVLGSGLAVSIVEGKQLLPRIPQYSIGVGGGG
jgi:hypothetical protein